MGDKHLKILLVLSLAVAKLAGDFISECPKECKCTWESGKKQANCSNSQLKHIPTTLSPEIHNLDLSGNELNKITRNSFKHSQLIYLMKLTLRRCKLKTIHKNGFSGLEIMYALDLSENELKTLNPETFKETTEIRWISLNDNQLEQLEDGLFNNLPSLNILELSNNRIVTIGMKTFVNVPKLHFLSLDGNKLEMLQMETLSALTDLSILGIYNNPWRCDCYLQPFRDWLMNLRMSRRLSIAAIVCEEPPRVHGKLWEELDSSDFACHPSIIYPSANTTLQSADENVTLSCQVNGIPLPEVNWVLNGQIINGYNNQNELKYYFSESSYENSKWVNLTIIDAEVTDNGEYLCVAKNAGGVEEINLTLVIPDNMSKLCENLKLDPSLSIYYCSICGCM